MSNETQPLVIAVDDDETQRASYEIAFREAKYRYQTFGKRSEAYEFLDSIRDIANPQHVDYSPIDIPAVAILDQRLEDFDKANPKDRAVSDGAEGLSLIRPIKALSPNTQVVMITAYAKNKETRGFDAGTLGAVAYWDKAEVANPQVLKERLAKAVNLYLGLQGIK